MKPGHSNPQSNSSGVLRWLSPSVTRELGILLCLSVGFPFMIHTISVPENAQLGLRLLPMFYAPLLAALWGRMQSAVTVALLAPWLNWALTSHPSPLSAIGMTVQLLGFVFTLRILLSSLGARWLLAAPAYLSGMAASALASVVFPTLIGGQGTLTWVAKSMAMGLPGIAILILINWLALRYYPPSAAGGGSFAT